MKLHKNLEFNLTYMMASLKNCAELELIFSNKIGVESINPPPIPAVKLLWKLGFMYVKEFFHNIQFIQNLQPNTILNKQNTGIKYVLLICIKLQIQNIEF